jgi:hypothetical protein
MKATPAGPVYGKETGSRKDQSMKTIWLTSLTSSQDMVKSMMAQLNTYGLEVKGHFWEDDLEKVAWSNVRDELLDPAITLWAVLGSREDLCKPAIRYGLSLLAITVQAHRGFQIPVVLLQADEALLTSDAMTTPLKAADIYPASDTGLGAKLVAKVHKPPGEFSPEYRLDAYGNAHIGQWFELGPGSADWQGAMFGVSGGEIALHAVGPKGKLPNQSVLNYPLKGLKVALGEKEYVAWAVQNELDAQSSYYLKVEGFPDSVIFGPYSTDKETELYTMSLK